MVRQGLLIRAALGLAACLLTALVYISFLDSPFVLDDRATVLLNPSLVDTLDWHSPVMLTFAIDRAYWGFSSFGFHITNGVLHVVVVALLFGLCTRLVDDHWTAFVAAAGFGIDPLTARSAAYVSARADLLFAAGVLVVVILARRAFERASRGAAALAGVAAAATLTAVPWGAAPHGPQRFYLTIAFAALLLARAARPLIVRSRAARVAGVLLVLVLILYTRAALRWWSDPIEVWSREVARAPSAWDAHLGYGDALREASRCGDAVAQYRDALAINPRLDDARRGLAACERLR